jgi:cell division GTPase FtsZ
MNLIFLGGFGGNMFNWLESQDKIYPQHTYHVLDVDPLSVRRIAAKGHANVYCKLMEETSISEEHLTPHVRKDDLNIIIAGLGGRSGGKMALAYSGLFEKERYHACFIVVLPFSFEGKDKSAYAILEKIGSSNIVLPIKNQNLVQLADKTKPVNVAFSLIDNEIGYIIGVLQNNPAGENSGAPHNDAIIKNEDLERFFRCCKP